MKVAAWNIHRPGERSGQFTVRDAEDEQLTQGGQPPLRDRAARRTWPAIRFRAANSLVTVFAPDAAIRAEHVPGQITAPNGPPARELPFNPRLVFVFPLDDDLYLLAVADDAERDLRRVAGEGRDGPRGHVELLAVD